MRKYYLAYGSNLNERQMKARCPGAVKIGTAVLDGYRLTFRGDRAGTEGSRRYRDFGVANIEPRKGCSVPVGIWSITQGDERSLDRYEGFPNLYYKETINVRLPDLRKVPAIVYIMSPGRNWAKPTPDYLHTIRTGYRDFGFDDKRLLYAARAELKGVSTYGKA